MGEKGGEDVTKDELGALILQSQRQLYVTARAILKSDADIADAMQETVAKAFGKLWTLRNDAHAKTWLTRILINECYTIIRKRGRTVSLEAMGERAEEIAQTDGPQDYAALYRAIGALPEALRLPVTLYYLQDFSVREVAKTLHITEGAAAKRLARAREKLRDMLGKEISE